MVTLSVTNPTLLDLAKMMDPDGKIAQIVESNNGKILSSYIMSSPDSTKLEVALKINDSELTRIIRTFERYDYTIKASFQNSEEEDDIRERYESLMNFLKF